MKRHRCYYIFIFICSIWFGLQSLHSNPEVSNMNSILNNDNLINITFRDSDISDVLRSISEICQVNIVTAKNVRGKVTISLKDVTLKEALESILLINNFSWKVQGNIILVEAAHKIVTEFIQLKYADGAEMLQLLEPLKSDAGLILMDVRSNKLIVKDYPEILAEIKNILDKLDIPTMQVTINVKMIDMYVKDAISLGLNLGLTSKNADPDGDTKQASSGYTLTEAAEGEAFNEGTNTSNSRESARSETYGVDLRPTTAAGTFGYDYNNLKSTASTIEQVTSAGTLTTSIINAALSDVLNVKLDALITADSSLLLASPTVTTLNNETASIIIGEKVGIKEQTQTTTGTTETIRFHDVGTKLQVTPQINSDGYITMTIVPEISSVAEYTGDTVRFTTREAKTKVRVKNGETVILGGLVKNEDTLGRRRVPFLSRIPILGIPFRSKYDSGEKKELVLFLTPHIINVKKDANEDVNYYNDEERTLEAKLKEEEMMKDHRYGSEFKENSSDETIIKELFKEARNIDKKSKKVDEERSGRMMKVALNRYNKLIEAHPESKYIPEILYYKALINERMGKRSSAITILDEILEKYPHLKIYKKALKQKTKMAESNY